MSDVFGILFAIQQFENLKYSKQFSGHKLRSVFFKTTPKFSRNPLSYPGPLFVNHSLLQFASKTGELPCPNEIASNKSTRNEWFQKSQDVKRNYNAFRQEATCPEIRHSVPKNFWQFERKAATFSEIVTSPSRAPVSGGQTIRFTVDLSEKIVCRGAGFLHAQKDFDYLSVIILEKSIWAPVQENWRSATGNTVMEWRKGLIPISLSPFV